MLKLVMVAALVAVTTADSGGGAEFYTDGLSKSKPSQRCAGVCKDSAKFSLQPGWTYVYNYEGTTTSEVAGSSNETSQISILAKALVRVAARPCELILVVRDVQLLDSDGNVLRRAVGQKEFAAGVEQFPLRFSYQDGRVEQLCPSADEPSWALNVKRGLLSVFQNSMSDLTKDGHMYERDVSGSCETTYSVSPMMWSDVKVLKFKNLQNCNGKGHQTLGLPVTGGHVARSTPIIRSEQVCEQTIRTDNGSYLANSRCQEIHVFAPFSNGQSGIRTIVEASLSLDSIRQSEDSIPGDLFVNKRTSLQFDYSSESGGGSVTIDQVWAVLHELVAHSQLGVERNVPQLFDQLVQLLSKMDDQQLVKVFDEVRDPRIRSHLLNALPLLGSAGSVWAMYQIYSVGEVSREEVDSWLSTLAFHQQPSLHVLDKLSLFLSPDHPRTWLAISAVVHSYCKHNPTCQQSQEVQRILATLEAVLGKSCHTKNNEHQKEVIVALKAIGNAGVINSLETLEKCFKKDNKIPLEVRLTATSALRRMPCGVVSQLPLLHILLDKEEDSELRIAAYLALLQCPSTSVLSRLRDMLHAEDTNQVLSFIWTHLKNIQVSNSPWRKDIRHMLQDTYLANKFKTDVRKFSRNYEISAYSDILNSGVTADTNVIFSTKSYLPRSANLNLTLDLFGQTINIFEIGSRIEGYENIVENIFGPHGLFPDESMQKMLKNMRGSNKEDNNVIRSFSESFKRGMNSEPHGSMFVRVLGNELYQTQFTGLGGIMELKDIKKQSLKFFRETIASTFTNRNIDFSKSFRFINTEIAIPTIIGLPLKVKVNGTGSVGMQFKTEVDLEKIIKKSSGKIIFSTSPSVAINIDGKMTVDATYAQAGIETKGSLSSNMYIDTNLKVEKGQVVDVFFNVPREKVEVINVTSSVFVKKRDRLVEIDGVGEVSELDSCSGDRVPTFSGLRVCSQYVWRNASAEDNAPYFPLTGKFQYALGLHKTDEFEFYKFHLKQNFSVVSDVNTHVVRSYSANLNIELDTPGSKLNRRIGIDLSFDTKDGNAKLELASPAGSVEVNGRLAVDMRQTSGVAEVGAKVNGKDYAVMKVGLQSEGVARSFKFQPSFILQVPPNNIDISISGHLHIVQDSKYSADVTACGLTNEPIEISGDISAAKGRYSVDLSAKAEALNVKFNSYIVHTAVVTSCKSLVRYILPGSSLQTIDFSGKLQNQKKGGFTKKHLIVNLQMSQLPQYSMKMGWILYKTNKYIDSNMDFTVGQTQWKSQQMYHNNLQSKNKKFEAILSLECPSKNLDYRTELQYKTSVDKIHSHALAQLSKRKRFIIRADYEDFYPRHTLNLEASTPWNRALLEGELLTMPEMQAINSTVLVKWGPLDSPRWLSVSGRYQYTETQLSATNMVAGKLKVIDWEDPVEVTGLWRARSEDGLIHSESVVSVVLNKEIYLFGVNYTKNPISGKHNVDVELNLPENSYKGNFLVVNNQDKKNVTIRLDLEKTLYFTTQLLFWRGFDLQLYWNYLEDKSQSVLVQYKTTNESEIAIISMPGHYASLTVDKLAPGFSSMNITAMWGENEDSATNAILLSTYWSFNVYSVYYPVFGHVLMPVVQAKVCLITPFVGFEKQSFVLKTNSEEDSFQAKYSVIRKIKVFTKWQEQFFNFDFLHNVTFEETHSLLQSSSFSCSLHSSLEVVKDVTLMASMQDVNESLNYEQNHEKKIYTLSGSYNNHTTLVFNSSYNSEVFHLHVVINDLLKEDTMYSSELIVQEGIILTKFYFRPGKRIFFKSSHRLPDYVVANLETPFAGFENSIAEYNFSMSEETIVTKLTGKAGNEFFLLSASLHRPQSKFNGKIDISSSSIIPDVSLKIEHEINSKQYITTLKESFAISLSKRGKILQSGQGFLYFTDHDISASSKMKNLETLIVLPGHSSSLNYTHQTQVKTTGVEVVHQLKQLWNSEKTDLSFIYEDLNSVGLVFKRNYDKMVEFAYKKNSHSNYKMDLFFSGGYSLKHRLFFKGYPTWENFLAVTSPLTGKVIIKNLQTVNAEGTSFVHKSTFFLNKEVAYVDFIYNLDSESKKLQNILFSTTSPWNHPVTIKYDLLIDTGATLKHELQFQFSQEKEIKAVFDVTDSGKNYSASFNVYSPFCKTFGGEFGFQDDKTMSEGKIILNLNENEFIGKVEIVKNDENPLFSLSVTNSSDTIINLLSTYDLRNLKKEIQVVASYYDKVIEFGGNYTFTEEGIKINLISRTPISGWKEVSIDFYCKLLLEYSMFAIHGKKDNDFLIFSGTGSFLNYMIKSSMSIDYSFSNNPKKHSALFEYHGGKNNMVVSFNYINNEIVIVNFNINFLKETETAVNLDSYLFTYRSQTPLEIIPDSDFEIRFLKNNKGQRITGHLKINNLQTTFTIENTFGSSGIGHFDLNVRNPHLRAGLLLKHLIDAEEIDSYSIQLMNNGALYFNGIVSIWNKNGLHIKYDFKSSKDVLGEIEGTTIVLPGNNSFNLDSSLRINDNQANILYKVTFNNSDTYETKHNLYISRSVNGSESTLESNLEYKYNISTLVYLKGDVTNGNSVLTNVYYMKSSPSLWDFKIDSTNIFNAKANFTESGLMMFLNMNETGSLPNFLINLSINKSVILFETENSYTGQIEVKTDMGGMMNAKNWWIYGDFNGLRGNGSLFVMSNSIKLEVTSNVRDWEEISVLVSRGDSVDDESKQYLINVSKENQEILHLMSEGTFKRHRGNCLFSLTMYKFYIDLELQYEFSSTYSLDLNYNINGNKQRTGGKITLSADSARIDLATPIRGFEDLSFTSTFNKRSKNIGMVFEKNGKMMSAEISAMVEKHQVIFKGFATDGKDEYIVSIGAQKGTADDPRSISFYITAFKNKLSMLMLSFDGSFDFETKAGLKFSLSSYFYKQVFFEILSHNAKGSHTFIFNYIFGIDIAYSLKSNIVKDIDKPELNIESSIGPHNTHMHLSYNVESPSKSMVMVFRHDEEVLLKISGKVSSQGPDCRFTCTVENMNVLKGIKNLNISGGYNFDIGSFVDASFIANDVKYFNLLLNSSSLYKTKFQSSLIPTELIDSSYYISLDYNFVHPDLSVVSHVVINDEYYKCNANLTWNEWVVKVFYQLNTNAGYGFENADISALYKVNKDLKSYVNFIDFTIDNSTLFHVASQISYPDHFSLDLILPDSLFLPFVKEIRIATSLTEEAKTILFKYSSGSKEKKEFSLDVILLEDVCGIKMNRSEIHEDVLQIDKFNFSYKLLEKVLEFETSLTWENNDLLRLFIHKEVLWTAIEKRTLFDALFSPGNNLIWNTVIFNNKIFECSGVINRNEVKIIFTHPKTIYHDQIGLENFFYRQNVEEFETINVQYNYDTFIHSEIHIKNHLGYLINLIKDAESFKTNANFRLSHKAGVFNIIEETNCEGAKFIGSRMMCDVVNYNIYQTEAMNPLGLQIKLDLIASELSGILTKGNKTFDFGGKAQINKNTPMCSSLQIHFNSSDSPLIPFALKYETNCLNFVNLSVNVFEKDTRSIGLVFDSNILKKNIYIQGNNLYYDFWNVSVVLNTNNGLASDIMVHFGDDNVQVGFFSNPRKSSFMMDTSFKKLEKLEITYEGKNASDGFTKEKYCGELKILGSKINTNWKFELLNFNNGHVELTIMPGNEMEFNLKFENSKEFSIRMSKGDNHYEGKGWIEKNTHMRQGKIAIFIEDKQYEFTFEHFNSLEGEIKSVATLTTPIDEYFMTFHMQSTFDSQSLQYLRSMSIKYKTPYYPLDSADLKVEYSKTPVFSQELLSFKEFASPEIGEQPYEVSYIELALKFALKTKETSIDDTLFRVSFGNKYSLMFKMASIKMIFETLLLNNMKSLASHSVIEIEGVDISYLEMVKGKTILEVYFDLDNNDMLATLITPSFKNVLMTSKSQKLATDNENTDNYDKSNLSRKFNQTIQILYGKENIFSLTSHTSCNQTFSEGGVESNQYTKYQLSSNWQGKSILKSGLDVTMKNSEISTLNFYTESKVIQLQSLFSTINTDVLLIKALEFHVNKSFASTQVFKPKIVFERRVNEVSEIEYKLYYTNGFSNEKNLFSGLGSLKIPLLTSFSIDSNPSVSVDISFESYFAQYESSLNLFFQRNKLDASINWRRSIKPFKEGDEHQFSSLLFGGEIQKNTAEFYLNENRFFCSIENSEALTLININLANSKLKKNISLSASAQYTPLFLMTISHTVFDSPCSIEVKVDRKPNAFESALLVVYNNLKQEAYVNIYLDSNPHYIELTYIDIWQQNHEVSGQVEEKDDEVTFKGKINSPSLDENFLVITIGSNNDKVDLNLSDMFIFKVFKDDKSIIANVLIFDHDYSLNYKNENGVNELYIQSPVLSGSASLSLMDMLLDSFLTGEINYDSFHFVLDMNKHQIFNLSLTNASEMILLATVEFENSISVCQFKIQCNTLDYTNNLNIKHIYDPSLLVISVGSSYFFKNNLEVMLGVKNEEIISGIFEVKKDSPLFKTYLALNKENRSLEMTAEAPFFSEMDKVKINGIFKFFDAGDCEIKLSGIISSAETLMAHVSFNFINSDEVFSTGFVVESKFNNFNGVEVSVYLPLQISKDMKTHLVLQLPQYKSYEIRSSFCISEVKATTTAIIKLQDLLYSFDFKYGNTPFYSDSYECNIYYLDRKIQIGAWLRPKHPLTDYIYFLDINDERLAQLSHALVLQHNHFKSKLIIESIFKGHEKYGIDLELQNLKLGKVVKLLGSAPEIGIDLGIDFAFSYESLLDYGVLAQIRVPFENQIKTARLTSLQKFQRNLNLTKLNHTLACDGVGALGWELEIHGSAPFFWLGDFLIFETKFNINNNIYLTKLKSYLQPSKVLLHGMIEAPLKNFQKGEILLSGTNQLVGSELVLSLNSNELINASISEDMTNRKYITILSKWRNVLLTYLYEVNEAELEIDVYVSWDLSKKDTSQLGMSLVGKFFEKYENSVELLLPSNLVPKLGAKTIFSVSSNQVFSLLQLEIPGIVIEGKIASDATPTTFKSGIQLKWTPEKMLSKDIGLFYVTETSEDEVKTYITLKHFSLKSDVMIATYIRNSLYGLHLQYSSLKEEDVVLEFGYWTVEENKIVKSGMKFTALHHASSTLIYGVANVTTTVDFIEGGVSIAYIGNEEHKNIRSVEIFGKKNRKLPQIFLGLSSNGNTLGMAGSMWKKDTALHGITFEARINQNDPFRLEITQNTANPGIEAEISYSLSRTYRAYMGMPSSNELTAQISHTVYGRPNTAALATLRLNSSTILWGKFEFPPMTQLGQEFCNGIMNEYTDITKVSQAILEGFLDFVKEDFSEKVLLLFNSISSQSDMLAHDSVLELNVVKQDVFIFVEKVNSCYELDHFYLKTSLQFIRTLGLMVKNQTYCVLSASSEVLGELAAPLIEIMSQVCNVLEPVIHKGKIFLLNLNVMVRSPMLHMSEIVEHYRMFRHNLIQQCRNVVGHLRHHLTLVEQQSAQWFTHTELSVNRALDSFQQMVAAQVQRAVDYTRTVLAGFSVLGNTVQEMVGIVTEGIYHIKEIRKTMDWVARAIDNVNIWFTNFRLETYLQQLDTFLDKVVQLVVSDMEKNFGEYKVYMIRAQQLVMSQWEELSKLSQIRYIRNFINHLYQKARWLWSYTNMNERLRAALKRHVEIIQVALNELENRLDQEERDMRLEYEYNDENNSLTFTQELPFKWQSFNQLPEYSMDVGSGGFSIPAQEYSQMVQTVGQYLWQDAKLLPYLFPPLGADAIISGRKVVTFDNSFYEMSDRCGRYLLSADLYHETFSLILDVDQDKKNIILTTQNMEILVNKNFEVYINGKLENLPLTLSNGKTISLERKPNSVYISSTEGFNLECNAYQDQCKFHLDGWYTGKVAGLFGTYNNEPLDDFIDPNWSHTESIEDFVSLWLIETPSCNVNTSNVNELEKDTPTYESMCELFFSSQSSPFYPCFHVIDPKTFYDMCLTKARKGNTCATVFAYLTKCTSSGVQLWMPEFCVTDSNSLESSSLYSMDSPVVTSSKMTVDVVLVVEEAGCIIGKDMSAVAGSLNTELSVKGMTNNRFAFISFNKKNAHIQTINGQIWTEGVRDITDVFSRLDTNSDLPSDYVSALNLATSLPFRPGASKIAVLIHCSSCPVDQPHSTILERLIQQDMSLHVLQEDMIVGKRGRAIGKAIGLEKNGAYPKKRLGKNTTPSVALLEQVSVPQDLCTPLVLGTNATLFNMEVLQKGLKAWGARVAAGAVPPTPFALCENTLTEDNVPLMRCHWDSNRRKLKEWDQTALEEYMDTSKAAEVYTEYEEADR